MMCGSSPYPKCCTEQVGQVNGVSTPMEPKEVNLTPGPPGFNVAIRRKPVGIDV